MTEIATGPHYLVAGHPIGHSLSPVMHQLALEHHGLSGQYCAVDVEPADLSSFISWLNRDQLKGANITIPYKQEFLQVVDRLDRSAERIGAMNTVVKTETGLVGYNTDIEGFLKPLEPYLDELQGESAIVFGTGGASRAVKYALWQSGIENIVHVSRNPGRFSIDHATDLGQDTVYCNYHNWQGYAKKSVILINCTPLGMEPDKDTSPVRPEEAGLLKNKICYDLVYNPLKTQFLKLASDYGAETIGGLEMFIGQGNRAFELWTGKRFPENNVREVLLNRLT